MNNTDLRERISEAYSEFYDEPRAISYWEISDRFDTDSLKETDIIADVIDMACRDSQNDLEKRDTEEVIETLAEWSGAA